MNSPVFAITRKELKAYFGSPMAAIFIGVFLLVTLFSFFWLETFYARNIADIRPLFRWMPLLLIFLVAALTMRQWSEEQKMGTMEILLTLPVRLRDLVLGKFLAVLALVALALILTLGLPVSVSFMGDMDWGPVIGGYLGALLMASAYIAIGLFISSRTDNQIIALILSVLVCGFFYLVGSSGITNFMGNEMGEFFRAIGTGSRFLSIERGVLDLRDLVYYLSLSTLFLLFNVVSLDHKRWSAGKNTARYRHQILIGIALVGVNLLAFNVWLATVHSARLDMTEHREYSISAPTRDLLSSLQEPLLLRGYFSEKTHPLLAPLVPRIRDMMSEYRIASNGRVQVEFVDPKNDEELEAEANQQYGIKPVPFQVSGRYEASVVNSYFNILVRYGDQFVTLGFDDLIEIQRRKDGQLDVGLRNLEYDLTKSIKKVVYGFQSLGAVFDTIDSKLTLTAVVTPQLLPPALANLPEQISKVAAKLQDESGGKLDYVVIDPDDAKSGMTRDAINKKYGIQPLALSLFVKEPFYLHLLLNNGKTTERIFLAGDMGEAEIRKEIEAAIKRSSAGFLKTIGLWVPHEQAQPMFQAGRSPGNYTLFQETLKENFNLREVDLTSGRVGGDIDVLLLVAPDHMRDMERLAVDQYLMMGGSVIVLSGNYVLDLKPYSQTLGLKKIENGLGEMLKQYGVTLGDGLIMDVQNEPFPVPVTRDLGGFVVQEIQQINYPFFVDVRQDGMDNQSPAVANLPAVTMNWVSPVLVNEKNGENWKVETLLQSSPDSWLHTGTDIQPDFKLYPRHGFAMGDIIGRQPLAVAVQGSFTSFFSGKPDPRNMDGQEEDLKNPQKKSDSQAPAAPIIKKSPSTARLIVVGSSEFINDTVIGLSRAMGQDRSLNSLQFLQNLVDWSVEDESLLSIRSRGTHARILRSMSRGEQAFWEWFNYAFALLALLGVSLYGIYRRKREKPLILDQTVL